MTAISSNSLSFFILVAVAGALLLVSGIFLKHRRKNREGRHQTHTNDNWTHETNELQ